jgi:hypothetical protein
MLIRIMDEGNLVFYRVYCELLAANTSIITVARLD